MNNTDVTYIIVSLVSFCAGAVITYTVMKDE